MLKARNDRQKIYIRINALDTGLTLADLAAVVPGKPDGIILPKCEGGADIDKLSLYLDAFEIANGIEPGFIRILPVATETAMAVLKLDTFAGCSKRLWGLTWGGEDLSAALGATRNRTDGKFHSPYLLARDLCLIGAVAAGVVPIDTIYADIDNLEGLREEADRRAARRFPRQDGDPPKAHRRRQRGLHALRGRSRAREEDHRGLCGEPHGRRRARRRQDGRQAPPARRAEGFGAGLRLTGRAGRRAPADGVPE